VDGQHQLLVVALSVPGLAGADAFLPAAGGRLGRGVLRIVRLQSVLLPGQHQVLCLALDQYRPVVLLLAGSAVFGVVDREAAVADERRGGEHDPAIELAGGVLPAAAVAALSGACGDGGMR